MEIREVAGNLWTGYCHLEDPTLQGGRLLTYIWTSGESAGKQPLGPGKRSLNQPKPIF